MYAAHVLVPRRFCCQWPTCRVSDAGFASFDTKILPWGYFIYYTGAVLIRPLSWILDMFFVWCVATSVMHPFLASPIPLSPPTPPTTTPQCLHPVDGWNTRRGWRKGSAGPNLTSVPPPYTLCSGFGSGLQTRSPSSAWISNVTGSVHTTCWVSERA